jgi:hypothetical protein
VHGDLVLAGPIWWIAIAFVVAAWVLSAVTAFDSLRAVRAERFAELPESQWVYFVPAVTYFVLVVIAQIGSVALLSVAVSITSPLIVLHAMVYLLRVAYPKQRSQL